MQEGKTGGVEGAAGDRTDGNSSYPRVPQVVFSIAARTKVLHLRIYYRPYPHGS